MQFTPLRLIALLMWSTLITASPTVTLSKRAAKPADDIKQTRPRAANISTDHNSEASSAPSYRPCSADRLHQHGLQTYHKLRFLPTMCQQCRNRLCQVPRVVSTRMRFPVCSIAHMRLGTSFVMISTATPYTLPTAIVTHTDVLSLAMHSKAQLVSLSC